MLFFLSIFLLAFFLVSNAFFPYQFFLLALLSWRDYKMVATSFGPSDTLFKFQLINSKLKLLKFVIVMNSSKN